MPAPKTQRADCACLYRLRESPQIRPLSQGLRIPESRSNLHDEWVEQAHTGNDFTRIQVFAEEHITASGLGRCNDERIVKRDASGLAQVKPCANDGRRDLHNFKLLVHIKLSPNVRCWQSEFFDGHIAILLQNLR